MDRDLGDAAAVQVVRPRCVRALVALALAFAFVAAACGGPPAPVCPVAPRDPQAPPLLWRVQRPGGPASWLYGTIHDAGADDVPPAAWQALDASPVFVSELGDGQADPRRLSELARLPYGQVLDRMLPVDDWWDLVAAMSGAMREDELRHARPWFALIRLNAHLARSGPSAPSTTSMDVALADHARDRRIAIAGLESWEDQLASLDASITAADLSAAIHARRTVGCEFARLRSAYRTSDLPALTAILAGTARSAAQVAARNRRWFPQLEAQLVRGAFVAVGLGHLLIDDSLLALLERAGYTVERAR